jgi:transcriptional antiterminator NusG
MVSQADDQYENERDQAQSSDDARPETLAPDEARDEAPATAPDTAPEAAETTVEPAEPAETAEAADAAPAPHAQADDQEAAAAADPLLAAAARAVSSFDAEAEAAAHALAEAAATAAAAAAAADKADLAAAAAAAAEMAAEDTAAAEAEDEAEAAAAEPAAAEPADDGRNWYVIHCYSGYENKVRHNLEQRIESMGMKGKIFDVVVPTEEEIEVKDGKRRTVERRVFPGYLLVQMIMSEDSWYVVRNTPGVTGFVGMGNVPTPLRPEEVAQILRRMEAEAPKVKVTFKPGQKVRIVDGPFNDFIGTVSEIDMDRTKVRVMVSFFGRETPVELDFLQVEKV